MSDHDWNEGAPAGRDEIDGLWNRDGDSAAADSRLGNFFRGSPSIWTRGLPPLVERVAYLGTLLNRVDGPDGRQSYNGYLTVLGHFADLREVSARKAAFVLNRDLLPGRAAHTRRPGDLTDFVHDALMGEWAKGYGRHVALARYGQPLDGLARCYAAGVARRPVDAITTGMGLAEATHVQKDWRQLGGLLGLIAWLAFRNITIGTIKPEFVPEWFADGAVFNAFECGFTDTTTPFGESAEETARMMASASVAAAGVCTSESLACIYGVRDESIMNGCHRSALLAMSVMRSIYPE